MSVGEDADGDLRPGGAGFDAARIPNGPRSARRSHCLRRLSCCLCTTSVPRDPGRAGDRLQAKLSRASLGQMLLDRGYRSAQTDAARSSPLTPRREPVCSTASRTVSIHASIAGTTPSSVTTTPSTGT